MNSLENFRDEILEQKKITPKSETLPKQLFKTENEVAIDKSSNKLFKTENENTIDKSSNKLFKTENENKTDKHIDEDKFNLNFADVDKDIKKSLDAFDRMLKGVKIKQDPNSFKEQPAFENIKDKLENEFLHNALKDNNYKNHLSNKENSNLLKQEMSETLKEFEQVIHAAENNKKIKLDHPNLIKLQNTKVAKSFEQKQELAFNAKTNQNQTIVNNSQTKATLKNLPSHVNYQLNKSIVRAINQNESTLKIQLKPAELGKLVLNIDNTKGSVKISIVAETFNAKELLTSNVNELKTTLASSGVNLERFEVDMSNDFKQSMADAQNHFQSSNKKNKKLLGSIDNIEKIDDSKNINLEHNGSIHYIA